ncbi:hypothetical protein D9611_002143 [Ephemerocybe angulata]|uniref:Uncharacterized protein n=1 Tax=Ephemerocybe angulata TaxID=980116 RepID=A0A8H5CI13_9AGAR|nr:hypothetical protein D9611_002143 [Tulosesus angulatus]
MARIHGKVSSTTRSLPLLEVPFQDRELVRSFSKDETTPPTLPSGSPSHLPLPFRRFPFLTATNPDPNHTLNPDHCYLPSPQRPPLPSPPVLAVADTKSLVRKMEHNSDSDGGERRLAMR